MDALFEDLIFWCGIGHFGLCIASSAIPKVLRWKHDLAKLKPLLRQMFWTYAVYIFIINFCFGIFSVFGSAELLNGSFLASSLSLFICIYWLGRIIVQFFYFDRSEAPKGVIYAVAEVALISLFALFTVSYGAAFFLNIS